MARKFVPQIATGNDLLEGDVVYLTDAAVWSREIRDAAVAMSPEAAADLLERAEGYPNQVVGAYLTDVSLDDAGKPGPTHFREEFRLKGPSNRPEHGRARAELA